MDMNHEKQIQQMIKLADDKNWVVEPGYWIRVARTEKSARTSDSINA